MKCANALELDARARGKWQRNALEAMQPPWPLTLMTR